LWTAADAGDENHPGRTHPRQHLGIVSGAARHAAHAMAALTRNGFDPVHQMRGKFNRCKIGQ